MKAHEDILVFSTAAPPYHPQITHGHERKVSTAEHERNSKKTTNYGKHGVHTYDSTDRYPRSVQVFPSDKQKSKLHPTQKPVALFEYLIKTYSKEGDLVLDVAAGSGTTGVAALNLDRGAILIENDPDAYRVMHERLDAHLEMLHA
jgi:site-specific DNA-methyltransferase (adenine-specific)